MDIKQREGGGYTLFLSEKEKDYLIEAIDQDWAAEWIEKRLSVIKEIIVEGVLKRAYAVALTEEDRTKLYSEIDSAACLYEDGTILSRTKSGHFASVLQARLTFVKDGDDEYKKFLCPPPPEEQTTIQIDSPGETIQQNPTDKAYLLIEREALLKDAERLNWLEKQLAKKIYTGKCVFRWSTNGRGLRLHEISDLEADRLSVATAATIREAIDQAMRENDESDSGGIQDNPGRGQGDQGD